LPGAFARSPAKRLAELQPTALDEWQNIIDRFRQNLAFMKNLDDVGLLSATALSWMREAGLYPATV
jgi:hypothetical protein